VTTPRSDQDNGRMPPELAAPEDDPAPEPAPDRAGTSAAPRNAGTGPVTIRTWIASPAK